MGLASRDQSLNSPMMHTLSASAAASLGRVNVTLQTGRALRNFFSMPWAGALRAWAALVGLRAAVTLLVGAILFVVAIFVVPPREKTRPRRWDRAGASCTAEDSTVGFDEAHSTRIQAGAQIANVPEPWRLFQGRRHG